MGLVTLGLGKGLRLGDGGRGMERENWGMLVLAGIVGLEVEMSVSRRASVI
jgi:hypothetical protein